MKKIPEDPQCYVHQPAGVAVVSVMVLVLVCAALASAVIWKSNLSISRLENQRDLSQARWIARAAADYARWVLVADIAGIDPAASTLMDHLYEPWAQPIPMTSLDQLFEARTSGISDQDLTIAGFGGRIVDEQSRFNLGRMVHGSLIDSKELKKCELLLDALGLNATQITEFSRLLRQSIAGQSTGPLSQPRHRILAQIIDALAVSDSQRDRLRDALTWLPRSTAINVNTASPEVILAMVGEGNRALAERIVQARAQAPLRDLGEINAALTGTIVVSNNDLDVKSGFFRAIGVARFGKLELGFQALLMRQGRQVSMMDYFEN